MTPDFSNILGQETVKKIYEDGASKPIKEASNIAVDLVKVFRLFTFPLQLLASFQDRITVALEEVRNSVPKERQIECPPSISGPIIEKLKYIEDTNYLRSLYLNLLKRAIDKERVNEAHPAFVTIIEQLSPDEALIISTVAKNRITYESKVFTIIEVGDAIREQFINTDFPKGSLNYEQNFEMYISHLVFLNLLTTPVFHQSPSEEKEEQKPVTISKYIRLTDFGKLFYKACGDD